MELTTEQKARVFAQYIGQPVQLISSGEKENVIGFWNTNELMLSGGFTPIADVRIILKSLSAITDEDAIEVAKLWAIWADCADDLRGFVIDRVKWVMFSGNKPQGDMPWIVREYLIQKGYALPLFIAPDHPCNGMDAIQLGLAIDSTTLP